MIEMNPRVSRSSALASKATGFPIAKIAALLCVKHDRAHLERALLGPLRREVAAARARAAVAAAGLAIEEERDVAGEVRLVVRRRS